MKILGADICKNRAVCWLLEEWPSHLRNYWKAHSSSRSKNPREDELTFFFTRKGISQLLTLKPDAICLEPTGMHYSWLLAHICQCEGIQVLWVGHCEATYYRKQNKLPDKNDLADALALAAYAFMHWDKPEYFLSFEPGAIAQIREKYLQLKSLARIQSLIINRSRQQLAREFPEAALKNSQQASDGLSPLWAWLANQERQVRYSPYYDRLYSDSIAPAYGVEISSFTSKTAQLLCDIHLWEKEIEQELYKLLLLPEFKRYNRVFDQFGIGLRPRSLLLSHVYPISKFESLGSFKKRLGMAGDENSSGDRLGWKTGSGSKQCRCELYLWILCCIAPKKNRPKTPIGKKLGEFYDNRYQQFQQDPELWKQRALSEQKNRLVKQLKRQMNDSMVPMLPTHLKNAFQGQLDTSTKMFEVLLESHLNNHSQNIKQTEAKKGFGNLIICQTAAYGTRLLFRELKRALELK